ncbi:MAG: hypothetical protein ACJ8I9_08350 [Chthoniobacterales bacterium]
MNGTPGRIEIFAPFGAALELMKKILFQPFDIKKWFVIGFAAFLSHLAGGGGNFGNFNRKFPSNWKSSMQSTTSDMSDSAHHFPFWVIPVGIIAGLIILAIVAVCLWVGSRGKFIFTDCIVRNRAAIAEPWNDFRREGNSLFVFSIVVALLFLAVIVVFGSIVFLPMILHGTDNFTFSVSFIIGGVSFAVLLLIMAFAWALISQFMVPIMYRRRCTASEAFRATTSLITAQLGLFILYFLFLIVLGLGTAMIACVATCVTCCITAIPYVGTVILLPLYVTLAAYPLLFVRQFGSDYDAWATVAPPVTSEPPIQPPPTMPPEPPPTTPPAPPALPA